MVSERVNLIHKTSPYGKKKKKMLNHSTLLSVKELIFSLLPIREGIDFLLATYPCRIWFFL